MGDERAEAPFAGTSLPRPFGDYVLLEHLAQGGMGDVFFARAAGGELGIERPCVVKALRQDFTTDESYVKRFIDEARLVVQLRHPNICHVFDVGRVGDQYYLAMEYVKGWNLGPILARSIERQTPVPEEAFFYVVAEALHALDYAHKLSDPAGRPLELVHRDVTPHNLMVTDDGQVKLLDFGIASSRLKVERTAPRVVLGKLAYMSPEHARGQRLDGRSDQFAAAVVLYELLVRERFYQGLERDEIWDTVGRGAYRPRLFDALTPDVREVLDRALAKDRDERFASCGDFEDALRQILAARQAPVGAGALRDVLRELFDDDDDEATEVLLEPSPAKAETATFDVGGPSRGDALAAQETEHFAFSGPVKVVDADAPTAQLEPLSPAALDDTAPESPLAPQATEILSHRARSAAPHRGSTSEAPPGSAGVKVQRPSRAPLIAFGVLGTVIVLLAIFATALLLRQKPDAEGAPSAAEPPSTEPPSTEPPSTEPGEP